MNTIKIISSTSKVVGCCELKFKRCNKKPNKIDPSDERYYFERFVDFMQRHIDCQNHTPPVYYFGTINEEPPSEKDSEKSKQNIEEYIINIINSDFGGIELYSVFNKVEIVSIFVNIKRELQEYIDKNQIEQNKSPYQHGDKKVIPYISNSYGYKYCIAFGKILRKYLSTDGQEWIDKTLKYLQNYMENGVYDEKWMPGIYNLDFYREHLFKNPKLFYKDIELDNEKFQAFAFATHPVAYMMGGLGKLVIKKRFTDLILILLTPNFIEWKSSGTRKQAIITTESLLKELILGLRNKIVKFIHTLLS